MLAGNTHLAVEKGSSEVEGAMYLCKASVNNRQSRRFRVPSL